LIVVVVVVVTDHGRHSIVSSLLSIEYVLFAIELIELFVAQEHDSGEHVRGREIAAAKEHLQYGADLFVRVFIVQAATIARVEATVAAEEETLEAIEENVALANVLVIGQMRYGIKQNDTANGEYDDGQPAENDVDEHAREDVVRTLGPVDLDEPDDGHAAGGELENEEKKAHVQEWLYLASWPFVCDRAARAYDCDGQVHAQNEQGNGEKGYEIDVKQMDVFLRATVKG
jgi:hypothetical protein